MLCIQKLCYRLHERSWTLALDTLVGYAYAKSLENVVPLPYTSKSTVDRQSPILPTLAKSDRSNFHNQYHISSEPMCV